MKNKIIADRKKIRLPISSKVMVVDDEKMLGEIAARILEKVGYEVIYKALSAEDALDFLAKLSEDELPSVIVTDFHMPGLTGGEMAHKIKSDYRNSEIQMVLVSGAATSEEVNNSGIDAFLQKPYSMNTLASEVFHVSPFMLNDKVREKFPELSMHEAMLTKQINCMFNNGITSLEGEVQHVVNNSITPLSYIEVFSEIGKEELIKLDNILSNITQNLGILTHKIRTASEEELIPEQAVLLKEEMDCFLHEVKLMKRFVRNHLQEGNFPVENAKKYLIEKQLKLFNMARAISRFK